MTKKEQYYLFSEDCFLNVLISESNLQRGSELFDYASRTFSTDQLLFNACKTNLY